MQKNSNTPLVGVGVLVIILGLLVGRVLPPTTPFLPGVKNPVRPSLEVVAPEKTKVLAPPVEAPAVQSPVMPPAESWE